MDPFDRPVLIAHTTASTRASASPGPGAYNIRRDFGSDVTPIHLHSRTSLSRKTVSAPYYNLPTTIGKTTRIGIHGRPQLRGIPESRGPEYIPPSFGSGARVVRISPPPEDTLPHGRVPGGEFKRIERRNPNLTPGPGPAAYDVHLKDFAGDGRGGSRMSGSHDFGFSTVVSPGPAAYNPNFKAIFPKAPESTFHTRPQTKEPEVTPGYRTLGSTLSGPRFTLKGRDGGDVCVV